MPLRGRTCEHEGSDCVYSIISADAGRKGEGRKEQESGIVVRGGSVSRVEALFGEGAFELVEWRGVHGPIG